MAAPESVPATLAQLISRRGRSSGARPAAKTVTVADAVGQFGFTFNDAPPEPVFEAGDELALEVSSALGHETSSALEFESSSAPSRELSYKPGYAAEIGTAAETAAAVLPAGLPSDPAVAAALPQRPVHAEPRRERKLWSVAELVGVLRGRLEREYADVWVEGEISNCRPASSGHLYFTLKDGDAQLPVVLFRRQAFLLKWQPEDGLAVFVRGRVSVFESRGQLQLIAESLEPRGAGALQVQFEQLKAKLRAEGLFEAERKRALPGFPRTIGVVTSIQGAVIRDIVTVCRRRHGCMNILVYPSAVQGTSAAAEIAAGIRYLNRAATSQRYAVDVIVIARGGGSAEDLWAFNDEGLARTIAASELPVVSAVGHETDFTIADFVADLRAPTPSAAAEMITAAQHRIEERVQQLHARLVRGVRFQQMAVRQRYMQLASEGVLRRVRDGVERRQQRLDVLRDALERAGHMGLRLRTERLRLLDDRLRGQDVQRRVAQARSRMSAFEMRLQAAATAWTQGPHRRLAAAEARLRALSPMAVLERGYTLTFDQDGRLLQSAGAARESLNIVTRFADGTVKSRVEGEEKTRA